MIETHQIDDALESGQEQRRPSAITASRWNDCDRRMWLDFRCASPAKHEAKTLRTFGIGHALEDSIVEWVESTGVKVVYREKDLHNKYGTLIGRIDGVVWDKTNNTFALLENKTCNDRRFKEWLKKGIPEQYFAQIQLYLAHSEQLSSHGNQLTKCLVVALNKNTSVLHTEVIEYDPAYAALQTERIEHLIATDELPAKTESWACKFCPHKGVCLEKQPFQIDCRTCAHVSVDDKGQFVCPFGDSVCPKYLPHPQMVGLMGYEMQGSDPEMMSIDYGDFVICEELYPGKVTYTGQEFMLAFESGLIHDPNVQDIKEKFGATLTQGDRYE